MSAPPPPVSVRPPPLCLSTIVLGMSTIVLCMCVCVLRCAGVVVGVILVGVLGVIINGPDLTPCPYFTLPTS